MLKDVETYIQQLKGHIFQHLNLSRLKSNVIFIGINSFLNFVGNARANNKNWVIKIDSMKFDQK